MTVRRVRSLPLIEQLAADDRIPVSCANGQAAAIRGADLSVGGTGDGGSAGVTPFLNIDGGAAGTTFPDYVLRLDFGRNGASI